MEDKAKELYGDVLEYIRQYIRNNNLTYEEAYEFHEMLKKWVNKWV